MNETFINLKREVILHLGTEKGKVRGPEYPPFVLPHRWTFQTLKDCITDFVQTRLGFTTKEITQIYYKKAGKSRSVVALTSDQDIPAMLSEYPMTTQNGRPRGKRAIMVLAVDLTSSDVQSVSNTPMQKGNILLNLIG